MCINGPCQPSCAGKECGNEGCDGNCGTCQNGQTCENGQCINGPCQPDCAGKDCGNDGCDGSCGTCPEGNFQCVNGSCECTASCAGIECGDDGCGGSCGDCPQGQPCVAGECQGPGCTLTGTISCDQTKSGDTANGADVYNDYAGYDCGDFNVAGPEDVYSINPGQEVLVKAWLTDDPGGGNIYVMAECDPSTCIDGDFTEVTFNASPGDTFYLSIEGSNGATSTYNLHVICLDAGDCADGKIPNCKGYCSWGHWYQNGNCNSDFDCAELNFDGGDCDPE